jgi:hypothetical protein
MTLNYDAPVDVRRKEYSFADGVIHDANETRDECYITPELNQDRKCVRCAEIYKELTNFGRWQCARHTGVFERWRDGGRYACCSGDACTLGCRRCDHVDDVLGVYPDLVDGIPVQLNGRHFVMFSEAKMARFAVVLPQAKVFSEAHPQCVLVSRECPFALEKPVRHASHPDHDADAVREDIV